MSEFLKQANCIGVDPNTFFPEQRDWATMNAAKAICRECVVKELCLETNLSETVGIYGGTSARERQRIRGSRGL